MFTNSKGMSNLGNFPPYQFCSFAIKYKNTLIIFVLQSPKKDVMRSDCKFAIIKKRSIIESG